MSSILMAYARTEAGWTGMPSGHASFVKRDFWKLGHELKWLLCWSFINSYLTISVFFFPHRLIYQSTTMWQLFQLQGLVCLRMIYFIIIQPAEHIIGCLMQPNLIGGQMEPLEEKLMKELPDDSCVIACWSPFPNWPQQSSTSFNSSLILNSMWNGTFFRKSTRSDSFVKLLWGVWEECFENHLPLQYLYNLCSARTDWAFPDLLVWMWTPHPLLFETALARSSLSNHCTDFILTPARFICYRKERLWVLCIMCKSMVLFQLVLSFWKIVAHDGPVGHRFVMSYEAALEAFSLKLIHLYRLPPNLHFAFMKIHFWLQMHTLA